MTKQYYLVRADLALGFALGQVPISTDLPVNIGPFQLGHSPNAEFHLAELDLIDPTGRTQPDSKFPMSLVYLEHRYVCDEGRTPTAHADDALEYLEALLRLFQPGEVSVRRHGVWRVHEDGKLTPAWYFSPYDFKPAKPPTDGLHNRPDYPLDDDTLDCLIQFIDGHWAVLDKIPPFLRTAIGRFNSSYERRDLADRLIDLVIALEALFGDGEASSITYKVAMRGASWLHAPGSERCTTFRTIKKFYSERSKVVHGSSHKDTISQRVDELEGMVRASLRRFLGHQVRKGKTPHGKEIDDLIMTGKI